MNLTPRLRQYIVAALALLVVSVTLLWNWDPFHRRRHAEERAAASADMAASAALEVQGARESLARTETAVRQRDAAQRATAAVQILAQQSKDAHAPLSSERAARLRDHDRELCLIDSTLSGCSAND
jgi:hypothetical protein